jgi:hypothetical protein
MNIRDLDDDVLKQIIRDALPFSGDLPFPDLPDAMTHLLIGHLTGTLLPT